MTNEPKWPGQKGKKYFRGGNKRGGGDQFAIGKAIDNKQ
jgi:hypothetical protein